MPTFHKHLKRSLLSAIGMWVVPWVCCLKWNGDLDALTRKKAGFHCSDLNTGSSFMSQDIERSESSVETLEKIIGPRIITRGLTSVWHLKSYTEIKASKWDDAWHFLNINRNPNITVEVEREPRCLPTPLGVPIVLSQPRRMPRSPTQLYRTPDVSEPPWLLYGLPDITREYIPGSRCK